MTLMNGGTTKWKNDFAPLPVVHGAVGHGSANCLSPVLGGLTPVIKRRQPDPLLERQVVVETKSVRKTGKCHRGAHRAPRGHRDTFGPTDQPYFDKLQSLQRQGHSLLIRPCSPLCTLCTLCTLWLIII